MRVVIRNAAILYYAAVRGQSLNFRDLFHDLETWITSPTKRYWTCVRVKRGVPDNSLPGASGQPQVYFEGAAAILRRVDDIDLRLFYVGKVDLAAILSSSVPCAACDPGRTRLISS